MSGDAVHLTAREFRARAAYGAGTTDAYELAVMAGYVLCPCSMPGGAVTVRDQVIRYDESTSPEAEITRIVCAGLLRANGLEPDLDRCCELATLLRVEIPEQSHYARLVRAS